MRFSEAPVEVDAALSIDRFSEAPIETCVALAVDLGGPIIRQHGIETEGAVAAIRYLREHRFGRRTHILSQCDVETEERRRAWLKEHEFFERTGVLPEHVHFCRELSEKALICSQLGITCCVENRIPVMKDMRTVPNLFLYHPSRVEMLDPAHAEFMDLVFDPEADVASNEGWRPVTLMRTWNEDAIRLIEATTIFRHMPRRASLPPPRRL